MFGFRRCRCGHRRDKHDQTWGWTSCEAVGCQCGQFRWVRATWYWDMRYRRAHLAEMAGDRARRAARDRARHQQAEAEFWVNVYALSRFARPHQLPKLRNLRRRGLAPRTVTIPAQRSAPPGVPATPRTRWGSR